MATTKKMLVPFDPKHPDRQSKDFLAPIWEKDRPQFFGLKSGVLHDYALVVFVGREIGANDVFAKLVDSGRKIPDVNRTLSELDAFLGMVKDARIGKVLCIQPTEDASPGFHLVDSGLSATGGGKGKLP